MKVVPVDYDDEPSLVAALGGQQFLVISLAVTAPKGTELNIVRAAAKAGVPYIMPTGYGFDPTNKSLYEEPTNAGPLPGVIKEIEDLGVSSWISMVCGLWYEYSLISGPEWFGFDFKEKKLTLFDEGNVKINVSTWDRCGQGVARLLSLKELPEDASDKSPAVANWSNKPLYVSSFFLSQKDMFETWKRVSGDTDKDWTIDREGTMARYNRGLEEGLKGNQRAFAIARFVRAFFPAGDTNYQDKLDNEALGLLEEDLDARTKVAMEMMADNYSYWTNRGKY